MKLFNESAAERCIRMDDGFNHMDAHEFKRAFPFDKTVAKAYDRIVSQYAEGAEMDALFDAGEWSGPANARALQGALARVAAQFGMTEPQAFQHYMRWLDCHRITF